MLKCLAAAILVVSAASLVADGPPAPQPHPVLGLEVQLIRALNADTLHVGDVVRTKISRDWTDGVCKLGQATVLDGKVVSVDPVAKHKSFALSFMYSCALAEEPHRLVWVALLAPPPDDDGHRLMTAGFRSPSFGEGGGLGRSGAGFTDANRDVSGRQNATMPLSYQDSTADRRALEHVKTGQVWKLPHLRLDVGKGSDESTILASSDKQLRVPGKSILVLLPESAAVVAAADTPPVVPTRRPRTQLPPELGACRPPGCNQIASSGFRSAGSIPTEIISLRRLGYQRIKAAEMLDLEFGAAVAFLGEHQLLFTFNAHTLVSRHPADRPEDHPHMVRAVLFDRRSGEVERTVEWRVADDKQYLWTVDSSHIVVHDGDHLRWFGPDLLETHTEGLGGPLAWMKMSSDRQHYAVGVVSELHTPKEHADLLQADAAGPEEQVRVTFLNGNLEREGEQVGSSRALPPVLLDSGRVDLWRTGADTYFLRETPWSATLAPQSAGLSSPKPLSGEPRSFARMQSACIPKLTSLAGNLLMAEGCRNVDEDHWVKIFHDDGSPMLESIVGWREFAPLTTADARGDLFAITTVQGDLAYARNSPFHGINLAHETVRVHRATDGREVLSLRLQSPLPARQPVALSADEHRIAVIDGDQISVYPISSEATSP